MKVVTDGSQEQRRPDAAALFLRVRLAAQSAVQCFHFRAVIPGSHLPLLFWNKSDTEVDIGHTCTDASSSLSWQRKAASASTSFLDHVLEALRVMFHYCHLGGGKTIS